MPRSVPAGSVEHACGMEVWLTDTPPVGGRLRNFVEDFVVDEIGDGPRHDPDGKHVAARVRLTNWEHNHFIREAARSLRIGRDSVGFAGTKDKRAVTTQWFSFLTRLPLEDAAAAVAKIPRVEVLERYRTTRGVRLGEHEGNRFAITLRDVPLDADTTRTRLAGTLSSLDSVGGFPNFFGIQRFGTVRPITHLVGRDLVHGDVEGAVVRYVTHPSAEETADIRAARVAILERRDWKEAQRVLPEGLRFERAMVQHLSRDPNDFVGSLRTLPGNLVLLFIHAYQSYLFNRMLSRRIVTGMPISRALEGDLVLPLFNGEIPDAAEPIPVHAGNLERVNAQLAKGRGAVTLPLIGRETQRATGAPGEIENAILAEENVDPRAFLNELVPEASSRGLRRPILIPVRELGSSVGADGSDVSATVRFALPRGAYATTFLREVMKTEDITAY